MTTTTTNAFVDMSTRVAHDEPWERHAIEKAHVVKHHTNETCQCDHERSARRADGHCWESLGEVSLETAGRSQVDHARREPSRASGTGSVLETEGSSGTGIPKRESRMK